MDKLDQLAAEEAGEVPAGDTEPETPPETDPEPLIAGKYKTIDEAITATEHAQSLIGRQAEEIRQLREQFEQVQQALPQPEQQNPGYGDILAITPQQLNELVDEGRAADAMQIVSAQQAILAEQRFEQMLNERLTPLQKTSQESQAERVFNTLKAQWGDETVHRYREQIRDRIASDPQYLAVDTSKAVDRLSDMIGSLEFRSNKAQATPRDSSGRFAQGSVHVEGGSTPAPQQGSTDDDVDPEIAEIRMAKPPSDVFGIIPGKDAS